MRRRSSASAPSSWSTTALPLREVGDALGLPWWLRKLPPQAFAAPLPSFPLDREFTFRISSLIPRDEHAAADLAHARRPRLRGERPGLRAVDRAPVGPDRSGRATCSECMAAWAWFSQHEDLPGHRLLRRPWSFGDELQAGTRGAGRVAAAAAAGRMPGPRHREPVARRRHGPRTTSSWPCARSTTSSPRARRSTTASTSTPTTCTPACTRRLLDPQGRAARRLRRDRPARRGGDHAEHRAAARPRAIAGRRRRSGRRPTPGWAASARAAVARAACAEADPPRRSAPQDVGSLPRIPGGHAARAAVSTADAGAGRRPT